MIARNGRRTIHDRLARASRQVRRARPVDEHFRAARVRRHASLGRHQPPFAPGHPRRAGERRQSFLAMMDLIRGALFPALEAVLSCSPDYVVLGMSAETFWDGLEGSRQLQRKLDKVAKMGVCMGSDACQAALRAYGKGIRRLGVITPYMPVGDRQVRRFFTECGFEVVNLVGLKCRSPVLIAHESKARLRDAINEVNRGKVDAIVQVGTNLAMAE